MFSNPNSNKNYFNSSKGNLLDRLERKFGRYAIRNLSLYMVVTYIAGYIISALAPEAVLWLMLEPSMIMKGQVWRLVSWILLPPSDFDILTIITLYFYYSIGNILERTWGTFRYNLYIFSGIFMTILGAFLADIVKGQIPIVGLFFTTYYICLSIILAFTATYPNMQVLLMFIIPLKMKYLGIFYGIMLIYNFIQAPLVMKIVILCSVMNFIIFFIGNRNLRRFSPNEIKRKQEFKRAVNQGRAEKITTHKCAICGRTEEDGDDLEFRFCSKCNGNYEYCQDHLFTHTHVE